ncbi:MAG: sigma-54-dependent Fis family transcriptional regulator [Alistipes sp.]|nr:sigma-54-dependent Fis family transcriptional regulator [Candidatus Minthomonas equi]
MDLSAIKNRFGIIGNDSALNYAIETALRVAGTDLSVLIRGESGVGKEAIPRIIHENSARKHSRYVAINCGAIPEGTIESELFGHEKGAYNGATESRKGYFEEADGGTIFLDEVGDLPLPTQVRLLRVLETGEFIRVGSSKIQKTNVRVIAASNVDFEQAIQTGRFRMDLYYRLNTVPISVPPLRDRKGDIYMLFRKFSLDCADKYKMPAVALTSEARVLIESYPWPGNIRQLKNVAEQISVMEDVRSITVEALQKYIPYNEGTYLPVPHSGLRSDTPEMGPDTATLLQMIMKLSREVDSLKARLDEISSEEQKPKRLAPVQHRIPSDADILPEDEYTEPITDINAVTGTKSISDMEAEMIRNALIKHNGKRKPTAAELGFSERTLYRKIKELGLE